MSEASEAQRIKDDFRTIRIIWAALLAALGIYVASAHLLVAELKGNNPGFPYETLKKVLYVVSAATLAVAGLVRRALMKSQNRNGFVATVPRATRPARIASSRYALAVLSSAALAETIGVYGFMLFLLSGEFDTLYAFTVLSAAALLLYRPRMEELENLVLRVKRGEKR